MPAAVNFYTLRVRILSAYIDLEYIRSVIMIATVLQTMNEVIHTIVDNFVNDRHESGGCRRLILWINVRSHMPTLICARPLYRSGPLYQLRMYALIYSAPKIAALIALFWLLSMFNDGLFVYIKGFISEF